LIGTAAAAVALTVAGVGGYAFISQRNTTATPADAVADAPPQAVLDGVYRLDWDPSKSRMNGAPHPDAAGASTYVQHWAMRSACTPDGCVATAVRLDNDNLQNQDASGDTNTVVFDGDQWRTAPRHFRTPQPHCILGDNTVGPGAESSIEVSTLAPQADGTLRGVTTSTTTTNECGFGGNVVDWPLVATRVGDVPGSIAVPDPADAKPPPRDEARQPITSPGNINGLYRVFIQSGPGIKQWWAFRSACDATGCAAAAAQVRDDNHNQFAGIAKSFEFRQGRWENTPPTIQPAHQCQYNPDAAVRAIGWSLVPQPDGTFRGISTVTVLTDECGLKGNVDQVPLVAERIGDIPPTVVVADPALLLLTPQ